jgi:hypothetical protein
MTNRVKPRKEQNAADGELLVSAADETAAPAVQRRRTNVMDAFKSADSNFHRKPLDTHIDEYYGVEGTSFARADGKAATMAARAHTRKKQRITRFAPIIIILLLGLSVGYLTNLILYITNLLEQWKIKKVIGLLQETSGACASDPQWWRAYGVWLGTGLVCTLIAFVCVLMAPAAQSSGIPGVLAFLNGANAAAKPNILGQRFGFFSLPTMFFKTLSCIMSVASGLAVGPEGPLIHLGACCGRQVVRALHAVTGKHANKLASFLTAGHASAKTESWFPVDAEQRREFVAIGAGCAISAAFSAPLAGVMFVVEEAATKLTIRLLELCFLASAAAFLVTWSLKQSAQGDGHVKFDKPVISFCNLCAYFVFPWLPSCLIVRLSFVSARCLLHSHLSITLPLTLHSLYRHAHGFRCVFAHCRARRFDWLAVQHLCVPHEPAPRKVHHAVHVAPRLRVASGDCADVHGRHWRAVRYHLHGVATAADDGGKRRLPGRGALGAAQVRCGVNGADDFLLLLLFCCLFSVLFFCLFSCLLFLVSCFLFLVSCFLFFLFLVSCFLFSCFLFLVSCFLFLVSCFLFLVSCFLFLVSCFLFLCSCFSCLVSCFLFLVSCF